MPGLLQELAQRVRRPPVSPLSDAPTRPGIREMLSQYATKRFPPVVVSGIGGWRAPATSPKTLAQPTAPAPDIVRDYRGPQYIGGGAKEARIAKPLFEAIIKATDDPMEQAIVAALAQLESSGGFNLHNVTPEEASFGPFHINTMVRTNPYTGKTWTEEEAMDWDMSTKYVVDEIRNKGISGMLGGWNPGAANYYLTELPKMAASQRWYP